MLSYHDLIYLFHIFVVGPLLVYIGYYKEKVDTKIFDILLGLGAFIIIYMIYKLVSIKMMQYNYKTI
jgi:hypothetical protein